MSQIIGIKAITTKSGNKGYEYHVCDDFSEYDKTHATCYGKQVLTEYASTAFNVNIGDEVQLVYGRGFQGKAQLVNIIPLEAKPKTANK